jgi:diguanylate cyclase (GGDEF)-like protein/PAS domain S-box-containing protein
VLRDGCNSCGLIDWKIKVPADGLQGAHDEVEKSEEGYTEPPESMTAEVPHSAVPARRVHTGRLRALLLDPTRRAALDRIVRLAAQALRAPLVIVGVPEFRRIQIVSGVGVPEPWRSLGYMPLEATFCRFVMSSGDVFTVEDAARHPIASGVPRLENFPRVAYCGVPLRVANYVVGTLSVYDMEPRRWTNEDVGALRDLAASLARELEAVTSRLDRIAPPDPNGTIDAATADAERADSGSAFDDGQQASAESDAVETPSVLSPPTVSVMPSQPPAPALSEPAAGARAAADRSAPTEQAAGARAAADRAAVTEPAEGGRAAADRAAHAVPLAPAVAASDGIRRGPERGDAEHRYRRIFEASRTPHFVMSQDARFIEVNHAFEEMLGRDRDRIVSRSLLELGADVESVDRLLAPLQDTGWIVDAEVVLTAGDGRQLVCAVTANAEPGEVVVYHGTFRDVTAQKRSEAELVRSALQDPLTGLPNRHVFMDRLERLVAHAQRRPDHRFAVVFLDLDNFKAINDTHGHVYGDQLLIAAARRLEACLRQGDTVARIGGDEFAVLLDAVSDSAAVTWVVDRIQTELAEPITIASRSTLLTASIGIAITKGVYEGAEELLRDADEAMYRAKGSGRNQYVIFDATMHERALAQRQLEHDLRQALQQKQLKLHYQPVVELKNGSVTGMEALLRWTHPDRGILLPNEFITLAEQTGIIIDIGWWVLREACRQLRAWQLELPHAAFRLTMSVNLSAKQFVHPQLISKIDEILEETGLAAHHLRLDLTETVVMSNIDITARLLQSLRERNIQICIDDFGTGFSSIRQLRAFPISTLKIDRSFVGRLGDATDSREIVQSIIAIGRSMSLDAVAEGVETPEQLEQLKRLGARFAQGFLFSLPLDAVDAARLLGRAA